MDFYRRNSFPKVVEQEWEKLPDDGERIEVDYGTSTNDNVWYRDGKFRNRNGFILYNIIGWRPLRQDESITIMMKELEIKDRNGDLIREGDVVIGSRYWLRGDGYLKKKYPRVVRMRLEVIWNKFKGKYELKEIEPIDEDKEAFENNSYRGIDYCLVVDTKMGQYREDMICQCLIKEESFWKELCQKIK